MVFNGTSNNIADKMNDCNIDSATYSIYYNTSNNSMISILIVILIFAISPPPPPPPPPSSSSSSSPSPPSPSPSPSPRYCAIALKH